MSSNVYLKSQIFGNMPYNESTVIIGGLMHVPIIILLLRLIENRFNKKNINYQSN